MPDARRLFDLVFVLVVVFTLVQAPTLPWVARRLRLRATVTTVGLDVESSPLGALGADVLQVTWGRTSRLHGVEMFELRLPRGRERHPGRARARGRPRGRRWTETFVPGPRTMLRHGDALIVVSAEKARDLTEGRLRAVSRGGKLAGWQRAGRGPRGAAGR